MIFFRHSGCRRLFARWFLRLSIFLALLSAGALPTADAQRRLPPRSIPYSELEREEGVERLEEMRRLGIPGVYSFLFDLRVMPRRGEESRFRGQMWGARDSRGPAFRYEIRVPGDQENRILRYFARNGFEPEIWAYDTSDEESGVREVPLEELFTPIGPTGFTPFDLQMPFIFWEEFAYEGLSRVRGRSSHGFLMYPPDNVKREFPWLEGVRMFLDAEFNALTGAELVGEGSEVIRSFNIIEVKRVEDEWIVKTIDYRNGRSGDKTRLSIGGAALDLPEEDFSFSPDTLQDSFPTLPRDQFNFF